MIHRIVLKNYRSIRSADVRLQPLTLIVGANNTGKSNFLDSLVTLSNICRGPLADAFGPPPFSFSDTLCARAPADDRSMRIEAWVSHVDHKAPDRIFHYGIEFTEVRNRTFKILWETCEAQDRESGEEFHPLVNIEQDGSLIADGKTYPPERNSALFLLNGSKQELTRNPAFWLRSYLSKILKYRLDPKAIKRASTPGERQFLGFFGDNMASVLAEMRDRNPGAYIKLCEALKRRIPEIDEIALPTLDNGQKGFAIKEKGVENLFLAPVLSDGLLLFAALATLVHTPTKPSIVCLEEPEQGIHARRLRDLFDFLLTLSYPKKKDGEPTQVLVTTHSPYMMDWSKDTPERVLIAERTEGTTKITALPERLPSKEAMQDATLGELYFSGVLGGVSE